MDGVQFTDGTTSSECHKRVLSHALDNKRVSVDNKWRENYHKYFVELVEASAKSPEAALQISQRALSKLEEQFIWMDSNGKKYSLYNAVNSTVDQVIFGGQRPSLSSVEIVGQAPFLSPPEFQVRFDGQLLSGSKLIGKIDDWVSRGIMEPSAGTAIRTIAEDSSFRDLRDKHFVLLGAASAMGPIETLLEFGATVYAVELPRPQVWKRLINLARSSSGTLVVPVAYGTMDDESLFDAAGCDLLMDTPAVASWVASCAPTKNIVLGTYVYLDGERFTRISAATDAICSAVCRVRGGVDSHNGVSLAHLLSPTEVHCIPEDAIQESIRRIETLSLHSLWEQFIRVVSRSRYLEPNIPSCIKTNDNKELRIQDSIVWQQGPNYSFAKQVQKWRAIVSRNKGHLCSATVGPATLTDSVMHNQLVAAGMLGCAHFCIEAFEVSTSNKLLAGVLLWDIKSENSMANPAFRVTSPLEVFSQNAIHGGTFRAAFKTNSYTEVSALLFFFDKAKPMVLGGAAALTSYKLIRPKL